MQKTRGLQWPLVLVIALLAILSATLAYPQCPGGQCPVAQPWQIMPERSPQAQPQLVWHYERPDGHKRAVVRIECSLADGKTAFGSGVVFVWKNRHAILTAYHVVKGAARIVVWLCDGSKTIARLLGPDTSHDCAVLLADGLDDYPAAELRWGDAGVPAIGEPIHSCGFGPDGRFAVNYGQVKEFGSPTRESKTADLMVITGRARRGDSGGPMFDEEGRVAGVLSAEGGGEVVGTQIGRVHVLLARVLPRVPMIRRVVPEMQANAPLPKAPSAEEAQRDPVLRRPRKAEPSPMAASERPADGQQGLPLEMLGAPLESSFDSDVALLAAAGRLPILGRLCPDRRSAAQPMPQPEPLPPMAPPVVPPAPAAAPQTNEQPRVETAAENKISPWWIAFLPAMVMVTFASARVAKGVEMARVARRK